MKRLHHFEEVLRQIDGRGETVLLPVQIMTVSEGMGMETAVFNGKSTNLKSGGILSMLHLFLPPI